MRYIPKFIFAMIIPLITGLALAQEKPAGIFTDNTDIGNPAKAGSAVYDNSKQEYTLTGGGYNIWFERDEFHYLFNRIKGNFILTANFGLPSKGTEAHRKTGWMIRPTVCCLKRLLKMAMTLNL